MVDTLQIHFLCTKMQEGSIRYDVFAKKCKKSTSTKNLLTNLLKSMVIPWLSLLLVNRSTYYEKKLFCHVAKRAVALAAPLGLTLKNSLIFFTYCIIGKGMSQPSASTAQNQYPAALDGF